MKIKSKFSSSQIFFIEVLVKTAKIYVFKEDRLMFNYFGI